MRRHRVWLRLTFPLAVLLILASAAGVFIPGVYRNTTFYSLQAIAQDWVSLLVVAPMLVITGVMAQRGSTRALLLWLGGLTYLVYSYAIAAFHNEFNALFLVYVALFGGSLYALIGGLIEANGEQIQRLFPPRTPVKPVSVYLAALAILFYVMWLGEVVPAILAGVVPPSVRDSGTPTSAVHVLDMSWMLPALLIAAVNLWRKRPLGYLLSGTLLSFATSLSLAILSMIVVMAQAGYAAPMPQVIIFVALFAVSLAMLIWFLISIQPARQSITLFKIVA